MLPVELQFYTGMSVLTKHGNKNANKAAGGNGHDCIIILRAGYEDGTFSISFLHLMYTKEKMYGADGRKADQLAACILSWIVDGWKQQFFF